MKKILITICARGGSKGIPRKNIRNLGGQPLIAYTINKANFFKKYREGFGDIIKIELSTDDDEIKKVASKFGLSTSYTRSQKLANDTAGKLDVICDILEFSEKENTIEYDYILDLDVSAPMRTENDLLEAFKLFDVEKKALCMLSVSHANKNPYFNMLEKNKIGFFELSKKLDAQVLSRQRAPEVVEANASFYFYRRSFFKKEPLSMFSGNVMAYIMEHESFDLDHEIDFLFLDFLITHSKLSFKI